MKTKYLVIKTIKVNVVCTCCLLPQINFINQKSKNWKPP